MLIYVHKPTSARVNYGRLVNTNYIKQVEQHNWVFRNYGQPGSKITFYDGTTLIVTDTVQEISDRSKGNE